MTSQDIKSEKADSKNAVHNTADINLYGRFCDLGEYLFITMMTMLGFAGGAAARAFGWLGKHLAVVGSAVLRFLKRIGAFIATPFIRYAKAVKIGGREITASMKEKGFFSALAAGIRVVLRILFGKRGVAVTVFNYVLPIASLVFLLDIVGYANNTNYALELSVNGDFVGYVSDESTFTEAEKLVQQRINYMDGSTSAVSFSAEYKLEKVGTNPTLTKYQLADKMLASIDAQVVEGYGMYIGSSFYGVIEDREKIEATLEELLDVYRTGAVGETVEFESEITFSPGLYLAETMVKEDSIIKLITSKKSVAAYYTAVEGDSPLGIAGKLGMTMDEVAVLNPGFGEDSMIYVGDKFLIHQEEPFLAVTVTRLESYEENVDYDTTYVDDSTRYEGGYTITQNGEYGIDSVKANVSYINGVEVRRKVISRTRTKEPVEEIIAVGTKPRPSSASVPQNVALGQMYWPVGGWDGGAISETMYGYGGYYDHSGVDIAAPYGTPIYAAESGKVVLSQWYYGYGYCIMIQHDNGLKTVYGHCSALHVSVGERVTQGQQIGDVGATGQAYGNHLHFEVRINNIPVYPLDYLPWHKRQAGCVEY